MINTQASSDSTSSGDSSSGSRSDGTQIGICLVRAANPCNGNNDLDGRDHNNTR